MKRLWVPALVGVALGIAGILGFEGFYHYYRHINLVERPCPTGANHHLNDVP